MPAITESQLKLQTSQYLQILENQGKLIWLRLNAGGIVIEGEKRRYFQGVKPGCADFLVLKRASITRYYDSCQAIFIETKSTDGRQSQKQKDFQVLVERQGAAYHIVKSLEDIERILE